MQGSLMNYSKTGLDIGTATYLINGVKLHMISSLNNALRNSSNRSYNIHVCSSTNKLMAV